MLWRRSILTAASYAVMIPASRTNLSPWSLRLHGCLHFSHPGWMSVFAHYIGIRWMPGNNNDFTFGHCRDSAGGRPPLHFYEPVSWLKRWMYLCWNLPPGCQCDLCPRLLPLFRVNLGLVESAKSAHRIAVSSNLIFNSKQTNLQTLGFLAEFDQEIKKSSRKSTLEGFRLEDSH